ncbi:MAG TPA: ABC transporter permease [Vicinamibacterales bacterium]|nr:ABC transporter permease [Vicinamibacterales bacterium]
MNWLRRLMGTRRLERDLDKELRFHVESRTDDLTSQGVDPVEARRRALAEFGCYEPTKEAARDARGTRWLGDLWQDLRYTRRVLWSSKGFTAAAVLSLGVGLGANAAVFRVMDGVMFRPLDVPRPTELFFVSRSQASDSRFSHPTYLQLAKAVPGAAFAVSTPPVPLQATIHGSAQLLTSQLVSGNWFDLVGVRAGAGRLLAPSDDRGEGEPLAAVISDWLWEQRFSREPSVIGSTLMVNGLAYTVAGIAQPGFRGLVVGTPSDLWIPVHSQYEVRHRSNAGSDNADGSAPWVPQDGMSWLVLLGRAPVTMDRTRLLATLEAKHQQILQARHESEQDAQRKARALRERLSLIDGTHGLSTLRERLAPALRVLMGMSLLVLIVAAANLANYLLARGAVRRREFALRLAIGARRGRIIRQLLTESLVLAGLGGTLGIALALWGGQLLLLVVSTTSNPVPVNLPIDWRILGFGAALTACTGLAFGLIPALRLSRPDVGDALKTGGRVVGSVGAGRFRFPLVRVLVTVQVALSLLLVVAAALFQQTFRNLVRIDPGFERETILDVRFDPRLAGFEEAQLPALYARLIDEASRVPGVRSATLGLIGPATGSSRTSNLTVDKYEPARDEEPAFHLESVGPGYLSTMGMRLIEGRDFDSRDDVKNKKVAIINASMARRYFGEGSPIGRHFGSGEPTEFEVVGVVADTRANGLRVDVPPLAYFPLMQHPDDFARNLYVRVDVDPDTIRKPLEDAVRAAAPSLAVREVVTLAELTERTVATERMISRLAVVFGSVGVIVAVLGLYGTIAYSVARRTNEIGVRLALGASPAQVRRMVLRETLTLVAAGILAGVALVLPAGQAAGALLYGLSARDPRTLMFASVLVLATGLLVGAFPAWRASRVDPTRALRAD